MKASNSVFDFLGVQFTKASQLNAPKLVESNLPGPGYISFPDASVVAMANRDPFLMGILNSSKITFPDGKPSEMVAKLRGLSDVTTVSGYHLCRELLHTDRSHYFYGADDQTLEKMITQIKIGNPNAKIKGYKAPPFLSLGEIAESEQIKRDMQEIALHAPDFVWVGVSSPKQDYIMHYYHKSVPQSVMLGVGGVFLYLANPEMKSPEWIKKIGLRWLYRLFKEPGRLGAKYKETLSFFFANSKYFIELLLKRNNTIK